MTHCQHGHFSSVGGGIHHTAIIGAPPEHRDWTPSDPCFEPVIHPTARIEAYVTVDSGMKRPTVIGARTWLLKNGTHVGHDVEIGRDCEIACGVKIGGHVEIGDHVRIGLGALIRPGVHIGSGARIGMGAVVTKDVPAGEVWWGNPAQQQQADGYTLEQMLRT